MTPDIEILTGWIESEGGPLGLASRKATENWEGVGLHYDMACASDEWSSLVELETNQYAILFGQPLPAIAIRFRGSFFVLRGFYAESDDACIEAFARWAYEGKFQGRIESRFCFSCAHTELMLFDTAYSGKRVVDGTASRAASFYLDGIVSAIGTLFVEYDRETAFVVDVLESSPRSTGVPPG